MNFVTKVSLDELCERYFIENAGSGRDPVHFDHAIYLAKSLIEELVVDERSVYAKILWLHHLEVLAAIDSGGGDFQQVTEGLRHAADGVRKFGPHVVLDAMNEFGGAIWVDKGQRVIWKEDGFDIVDECVIKAPLPPLPPKDMRAGDWARAKLAGSERLCWGRGEFGNGEWASNKHIGLVVAIPSDDAVPEGPVSMYHWWVASSFHDDSRRAQGDEPRLEHAIKLVDAHLRGMQVPLNAAGGSFAGLTWLSLVEEEELRLSQLAAVAQGQRALEGVGAPSTRVPSVNGPDRVDAAGAPPQENGRGLETVRSRILELLAQKPEGIHKKTLLYDEISGKAGDKTLALEQLIAEGFITPAAPFRLVTAPVKTSSTPH